MLKIIFYPELVTKDLEGPLFLSGDNTPFIGDLTGFKKRIQGENSKSI